MSSSVISPAIVRLGVLGAGVVVALSLAVSGARTTWRLLGESGAPLSEAIPTAAPRGAAEVDIAPILALAPFGEPSRAGPALGAPAAETMLQLTLQGVSLAFPAARSSAFISAPREPARYYRVGEALPGGAVLESVARDHVLLDVGGRRETLSFPEGASARGVASMRSLIPQAARGGAGGAPAPFPSAPGATGQRISADSVIDDYRERIAKNPQAVLDDLGLSVVANGYRIGEASPPAVRRAGLQAGDVVTRVNGVQVGEVESDRRLFEEIVASGAARVEIQRGDRSVTLSFPLR